MTASSVYPPLSADRSAAVGYQAVGVPVTVNANSGYPLAPQTMPDEKQHRRKLAETANLAIGGKLNALLPVTLTASSTTTTVTDSRIGTNTYFGFQPTTADAAAALSGLYVSAQKKGSATLTHASTASTDRTFTVLLIG